jgi:hypothetical protein
MDDVKKLTTVSIFDEEPKNLNEPTIYLNGTFSYVVKNMIIDNDEQTLNDKSSFLSQVI